jgi:hypothetical protein
MAVDANDETQSAGDRYQQVQGAGIVKIHVQNQEAKRGILERNTKLIASNCVHAYMTESDEIYARSLEVLNVIMEDSLDATPSRYHTSTGCSKLI